MSADGIAKNCPICWEPFTATGRTAKTRIYCSPECKRTAAARREVDRASSGTKRTAGHKPAEPPAQLPAPAADRDCPHCGGPITIVALLTTPEAARPHLPAAAPDGVIPLRR